MAEQIVKGTLARIMQKNEASQFVRRPTRSASTAPAMAQIKFQICNTAVDTCLLGCGCHADVVEDRAKVV
jgi:hypothetical protein